MRWIKELEQTLHQYDDLSPMAIRFLQSLARTARRHPRFYSIAKKIAYRLYA